MTEVMKMVVEDKKHHWAFSPHREDLKLVYSNYSVRGGSDDNRVMFKPSIVIVYKLFYYFQN